MTGTIKKKIDDRRFGFIALEDGSKDVFFHEDALSGVTFDELNEGDKVTFDLLEQDQQKPGAKGPAAKNVTRAE